jgi:outer membrane protein assembly factor BamB
VVVDDTLILGDTDGYLRAYDVHDTRAEPPQLWQIKLGGDAVEATPAVWKGRIYVAGRDGYFNAIGDR